MLTEKSVGMNWKHRICVTCLYSYRYEYHKACTEAYYSQAFASREELLDREWRFSASSKGHGLRKVALMSEILFPHIAPVKLDNVESYCQWLQRLSLKDVRNCQHDIHCDLAARDALLTTMFTFPTAAITNVNLLV